MNNGKNSKPTRREPGVIYPKYTTEELKEYRRIYDTKPLVDPKVEVKESKKSRLKIWQRAGLAMAAIGVLSALGGSVTAQGKELERQLRSSSSDVANSILDSYNSLLFELKYGTQMIVNQAQKHYEKSKPVVEKATEVALDSVKKISNDYEEALGRAFPVPAPVSLYGDEYSTSGKDQIHKAITPDTKPLSTLTPAVTRKLNASEIEEANQVFLKETLKKDSIDTNVTPTNVPRTPLAKVDVAKSKADYSESEYSTFSRPFESAGANEAMSKLGLTTRDIFYPEVAKMETFTDVISYPELLPVFTQETSARSQVVVEEVARFNKNNPDLQLSPNIFMALIQIETNGANVQSPKFARGIMQVTEEVAINSGLTYEDMSIPKLNVRAGIKYFAQGYKEGLSYGLSEIEAMKYAAMYYNGGPGNALKYFGFMRKIEGKPEPTEQREDRLRIRNQKDVKEYLNKYYGGTAIPNMEFFKYSTNMVALETELYADSFLRLLTQQKLAIEMKKNGLSDEQIRIQLNNSSLISKLRTYIKSHQPTHTDPFLDREVANYILDNFENGNLVTQIITTQENKDISNNIFFNLIRF